MTHPRDMAPERRRAELQRLRSLHRLTIKEMAEIACVAYSTMKQYLTRPPAHCTEVPARVLRLVQLEVGEVRPGYTPALMDRRREARREGRLWHVPYDLHGRPIV